MTHLKKNIISIGPNNKIFLADSDSIYNIDYNSDTFENKLDLSVVDFQFNSQKNIAYILSDTFLQFIIFNDQNFTQKMPNNFNSNFCRKICFLPFFHNYLMILTNNGALYIIDTLTCSISQKFSEFNIINFSINHLTNDFLSLIIVTKENKLIIVSNFLKTGLSISFQDFELSLQNIENSKKKEIINSFVKLNDKFILKSSNYQFFELKKNINSKIYDIIWSNNDLYISTIDGSVYYSLFFGINNNLILNKIYFDKSPSNFLSNKIIYSQSKEFIYKLDKLIYFSYPINNSIIGFIDNPLIILNSNKTLTKNLNKENNNKNNENNLISKINYLNVMTAQIETKGIILKSKEFDLKNRSSILLNNLTSFNEISPIFDLYTKYLNLLERTKIILIELKQKYSFINDEELKWYEELKIINNKLNLINKKIDSSKEIIKNLNLNKKTILARKLEVEKLMSNIKSLKSTLSQ